MNQLPTRRLGTHGQIADGLATIKAVGDRYPAHLAARAGR